MNNLDVKFADTPDSAPIQSLETNKQQRNVSFQKPSNEIINAFSVQIVVSTQSSG